jgi:P-type Ca2+ transporter type 2C
MLGRGEWAAILATATLQAGVMLTVYVWALHTRSVDEARSLAFTAFVLGDLFRSFAARSTTRIFWEVGAFTNLRLLAVISLSAAAQLAILFIPQTRTLFRLDVPRISDVILCVGAGLVTVTIVEVTKLLRRIGGEK